MRDRIMLLLYEWMHIFRQPAVWVLFFLFFIVGGYAIYSGNTLTRKKIVSIESAKKESYKDYHTTLQAFKDTLTAEKKEQAKNAGDPYIIDYRYPRIAYDYPYPLAGLATGIKDVTPVTEKVNYYTDYAVTGREITNPAILFEGRLDLLYVNLYLIPLLIIILTYNIISSEKEKGISRLLIVQSGTLTRILRIKFLIRSIVIFCAAVILNITGILLSPSGFPSLVDEGLWFFLLLSYCVFWISLCFVMISMNRNSVLNLFLCLASWIFLLFLLPLVINKTVQLKNPSDLKLLDLEEKDRLISDEVWAMKPQTVVNSFYSHYPEYKSASLPSDTVNNQNDAFFAGYYEIKQKRMKAVIDSLWEGDYKANQMAYKLIRYNPVQNTEHLFTLLARTSRNDYLQYKQDVKNFQNIWQTCFYNKVFSVSNGKRKIALFSPEELKRLPVFKTTNHKVKNQEFIYGIGLLWMVSLVFFTGGLLLIKKIQQ